MTVIKKVVAATISVLILVLCLSACDYSEAPVKNTPEEYEHHMELFESEALLGMTKEEVHETIGQPDVWRMYKNGMPKIFNLDCWEEDIHLWEYGSENEKAHLLLDIYFSDEGYVEQANFWWFDLHSDKTWSEKQGIKSRYSLIPR